MNSDSYGAHPSIVRRELLGPVRQIGYVVADVEDAVDEWVRRFGVGPWRVRPRVSFDVCRYRGHSINLEVSIASSYSDGIEVELIAQPGGPRSMYTDFVDDHGPGAQHVCFYPADYDAALRHLTDTGMQVELEGVIGGTRFSYLDDGSGQVIELADVSPQGLAARAARSAVAAEWDGSDPIRVVQ